MISHGAKYTEVRKWWVDYLESHPEPIPVYTLAMESDDIRQFIENSIYELDLIIQECKNGDKRRLKYANNRKRYMVEISQYVE